MAAKLHDAIIGAQAGHITTQDGLVLDKTVFEEEPLDLADLNWRVGFVETRQLTMDNDYIEFSDTIGAFELVRLTMNGTYQSQVADFETFQLRECLPGTAAQRMAYDSMLTSSDKLYCPPEDLEMSVSGDV